MYDIYEDLAELCEMTSREINEAIEKVRKSGGKVSPGDVDFLDKLTHMMKSIKTTMAMIDAEDEYGVSYDDGMDMSRAMKNTSYARGRGRNAKRDSMGRYASRGRSYDSGVMSELRELMNEAPDERTRQKFSKFIAEMEQM